MPPNRLRARSHQARCFWQLYSVLWEGWRYDREGRRNEWLVELKRLALRLNWMYRLDIRDISYYSPVMSVQQLLTLQRGGINTVSAVVGGVLRLVDSELPVDSRELDMDLMRWDLDHDPPMILPLLMGVHPRLGLSSSLRVLNDECLQLIAAFSLG